MLIDDLSPGVRIQEWHGSVHLAQYFTRTNIKVLAGLVSFLEAVGQDLFSELSFFPSWDCCHFLASLLNIEINNRRSNHSCLESPTFPYTIRQRKNTDFKVSCD